MLRRIEHAARNTAAAFFLTSFCLGSRFGFKAFLHKVHGVLKKLCAGISFFGVVLTLAWGRFGPGVEQAWSQARSRSRPGVAPESALGGFPVLPERSKRYSKTMEPATRIRDSEGRLKAPGSQKQQPEITDSKGDLLQRPLTSSLKK